MFWCDADLDDTLVSTREADRKAYDAILALAQNRSPSIDGFQLIQDWLVVFYNDPWDPEHQVLLSYNARCMNCILSPSPRPSVFYTAPRRLAALL
jgi:hypothetical protein